MMTIMTIMMTITIMRRNNKQGTRHVRVSERSKGETNPIGTVQRSHRLQTLTEILE